ncbi:Ger(x)C family spore germination protein [Marininema halotolerans]|uniref:Germination protein, Ger(X)C family n=1 Tax=Marininema halotolerans TaxID=1155944 RepID=A0A1I6QF71_9BACL|nr:Ger(x)C family spore germination protein [Marininema halotolerans]SFS51084.1 germination protein, Ger(x)C family [Marininema halotolerans]
MRRRHLLRMLPIILICLTLGGCWDSREIEDRVSVIATAIDEKDKEIVLNVQVPIPKNVAGSGSQGGGGGKPVQTFTGQGMTISDAIDDIHYKANQRVFFGNNRLLIIGESLAKRGLSGVLDALGRNPEFRRREFIVVAKGRAADFIKAKPDLEQVPTEYVLTMLQNGIRDGLYIQEGLNDFYIDLTNPGNQPVLNYMSVKGKDVKWSGIAVFKQTQMKGILNRAESRSVLQIRGRERGEDIDTECIEKPGMISFRPREVKRKVRIDKRKGHVVFHITLTVKGAIIEKTCDVNVDNKKTLEELSHRIASKYEEGARQTLKKVQGVFRSDSYRLGNQVRAFHPSWWKNMNWGDDFAKSEISIDYKVIILRSGMKSG